MKFSVVFALLLTVAQVHDVASTGIAKNARRHDQLGKRQATLPSVVQTTPIPVIPTPTPTPVPTTPSTSPTPVTPPPSTTTPVPPTSDTPVPTDVSSATPVTSNSDTPTTTSNAASSSVSDSAVSSRATTSDSTKKSKTSPSDSSDTATDSTRSSTASSTSGSSSSSSSSDSNTGIIVGGVVVGIVVVFGLIALSVCLYKRNKRLDRRTKALADEVDRGLAVNAPRPSGGYGPTGPSMTQHPFVPPSENTDEYQYHPAEYDPERYYQNVQVQQHGNFYPQPVSPSPQHMQQPYQSQPYPSTSVAYNQHVPQYQGQNDYVMAPMPQPFGNEGLTYGTKTEGKIAPSSPSMRPPAVDPNQHKPDELDSGSDSAALMGSRKPDVVDT